MNVSRLFLGNRLAPPSQTPAPIAAALLAAALASVLLAGTPGEAVPAYPDREHWSRAGARVPVPSTAPQVARVAPGADLQAAVDRAAAQGGGVIELAPGTFVLEQTLELRSGVVLRGSPGRATRLQLMMRGRFARERGADGFSEWTCGVSARDVRGAGLEDLEIVFDPSLPPPPTLRTDKEAFINDPGGRDDLWVVSVRFTASEDCWVLGSRILNSGSHPLMIEGSRHVTVRGCEIDGAHNKGGKGAGYLNITRSEYTRLERVAVRDIRHVAIQNSDADLPCRYNVLLGCRFEVDVNFHNGDAGHNLLQDCVVAVPTWHWWAPIGAGVPGQHQPPGPGNLVFRCQLSRTYPDPSRNFTLGEDPKVVYRVRDHFDKNVPILTPLGPAPESGTLVDGWRAE